MIFKGQWLLCRDGITRPVIFVDVISADGTIEQGPFLIDSGADRTVLSAEMLGRSILVGLKPSDQDRLEGIGGGSTFVLVKTSLKLIQGDGTIASFKGEFAAFTDPAATDLSILGRDMLELFDVILSRRRDEVLLLTVPHRYSISQPS